MSVATFNTTDEDVNHIMTEAVKDQFMVKQTEETTKIYASLVPDEIIYRDITDKNDQFYTGAVLFVDVSGFTDLCEKFNSLGKGGPSRITQVLNSYVGAMVQEIMSHNGDILKFSGDAFLALWKSKDSASLPDVVHAAIDCALGIQRSHGTFKTEVGIILKVKIAIAAGQVIFAIVGDNNFMVLGSTIFDVKDVGCICNPGEIIISPAVKMFITPNEYILEAVPNVHYTKIKGIGSEWSPSQLSNQYEIFDILIAEAAEPSESFIKTRSSNSDITLVLDHDDEEPRSYMLRPSLDYAASKNLQKFLRKFVIKPVVRVIDMNEPLEYLTEMRQVVIVFINVVTVSLRVKQLIELCDTTYRITCNLVDSMDGCVNKLSMFDKDLMFLVIFGLRGFKHSLEAQRALYCAKCIRDQLVHVPNVQSASIGVTSGVTYCGVVGHPMRKEYTVIGRTVNKAARLMVAYPDKVTCDRQTFLHSQLQTRYFTLQPDRYLKGFKNVGPIYKFDDESNEEQVIQKEMMKTKTYPLLGRPREIETFFYLLERNLPTTTSMFWKSSSYFTHRIYTDKLYKMLVLKGEARQGKTRLINEIEYCLLRTVSLYSSRLTSKDKSNPFKVLRNIFGECHNLYSDKSIEQRTEIIANVLSPCIVPEFLCALNDVLNVNFEVSKYYLRLNKEQQKFARCKMIKYLCLKSFKKMVVITIDNIEYVDDNTWALLKVILECGVAFFCVTMTVYAHYCPELLHHTSVITLTLEPIHEWFHAGLICQFMNVSGVPLELEKYIQIHSNGNPGWIESFLTTLMHSKSLEVRLIDKYVAKDAGIVMPPADMIFRDEKDIFSISAMNLVETSSGSFENYFEVAIEGWDIYYQTMRESKTSYYFRKLESNIPIGIIPNNIRLEEVDTEDVLQVQMIKTYDSLKFQEQQLLKCSSILGDTFTRTMLQYVMQSQDERNFAEAIMKLFEIRVFSCARGQYTSGYIQVNHHLHDPNKNLEIKCDCVGFPKIKECEDLPKYASCGYLRYTQPKFRQILYKLLTDKQATLYHVRAIWYLESKTTRCLSCGMGYFIQLNGQTYDDGMKNCSLEQIPSLTNIISDSNSYSRITRNDSNKDSDDSDNSEENIMKSSNHSGVNRKFNKNTLLDIAIKIRMFKEISLAHCHCPLIQVTMYTEMIEHCQKAGMNEKLMYALLEYATVCITHHNITIAFTLLERATTLLEEKLQFEYPEPAWQVPLARGRIMLLRGQLHIERKDHKEAELCLYSALHCYNLSFPTNIVSIRLKTKYMEIRQKIILDFLSHEYIGSKNEDLCTLADQTAEILGSLYRIYRRTCQYEKAYLATVWGLNEALRSNSNFFVMCMAYANMITMDMFRTRSELINKIEEMAILMCYRKHTRLEKHEVEAVVKLYGAIFSRKYWCENMHASINIGHVTVQLNSPQYGGNYKWLMLPMVLKAYLYTYNYHEVVNFLIKVKHLLNTPDDRYANQMYYIICVDFRLHTTFNIMPFEQCASYIITKIQTYSVLLLSSIEMRYHVALWLWYVRIKYWHSAANLYNIVVDVTYWMHKQDPTMIYISFYILEGYLLLIVKRIDLCDQHRVDALRSLCKFLFRSLSKMVLKLKCMTSRYLLLKSYWKMIFHKEKEAFHLMNKAIEEARSRGLLYEADWIEHNKKAWTDRTNVPNKDNWIKACESDMPNFNLQSPSKFVYPFYTFPLPKR